MIDSDVDLLVLGLGNLLCGDDGAGVAAVSRLRDRYHAPPGVEVLDGASLTGRRPDPIVLIGVVPASLDLTTTLTVAVEARLDALVDAVVREAARMGMPLASTVTA